MKYRKKPIVIEATKFEPPVIGNLTVYLAKIGVSHDLESPTHYSIPTLEGKHEVTPGDWIITGVKGEKYPCKPDIFELTYEKVDSTPPVVQEMKEGK